MSEPVEKRRPLIDLDEFDRVLRAPSAANETPVRSPVPSWLSSRLEPAGSQSPRIGGDFAAIEAGLLGAITVDPSARWSLRDAPRPLSENAPLAGDFAAIEAGLLSAAHQFPRIDAPPTDDAARQRPTAAPEPMFAVGGAVEPLFAPGGGGASLAVDGATAMLPRLDPSDRSVLAAEPADGSGADEETRSRLTIYLMAAIIVVGLGGIAAKFQTGFAGGSETTANDAAAEPFFAQTDPAETGQENSLASASVTEPDAAPTSTASADMAPAPAGRDPGAEQSVAALEPARTGSADINPASIGPSIGDDAALSSAPLTAPMDALAPAQAAPVASSAAPSAPVIANAAPMMPASALNPAPITAPAKAQAKVAATKAAAPPASASNAAPAAKTPAVKTARAPVPAKPAAVESAGKMAESAKSHTQTHAAGAAKIAAAKPNPLVHAVSQEPAHTAEAPPEPTAPPAQATNGVSSFMQMAVNSVNSAVNTSVSSAAKLLDWRRLDPNANNNH